MNSLKFPVYVLIILLLSICATDSFGQAGKAAAAKESNFCKPLNKKIMRISFTFLAFGKIEKESPDSYADLTYKKEEADESIENGSESSYTLDDQITDLKISCVGNSFTASYQAYKDDQGNTGHMTVSGTFSQDGKTVESCRISYEGAAGTGKYRKAEHRYSFEVKNLPSEKIPDTWKRTYLIDNYDTKTNIFSDCTYYEKKFNGSDYYLAYKLMSVDQSNPSNRFALTFYFVK